MMMVKLVAWVTLLVVPFLVGFAQASVVSTSLHYLFESAVNENQNVSLPVLGEIPSWVDSAVYRNGFGQFGGPSDDHPFMFNYLFDVMPMAYKWKIVNGKVLFSNKFIDSKYYEASKAGVPTYRIFGGTTPEMSEWQKIQALTHLWSDNLNVNLYKFSSAEADHLLALSDVEGYIELDMETLDTVGAFKFSDKLNGLLHIMTSAHPSQLPDNELIYGYNVNVYGDILGGAGLHKYEVFAVNTSMPEPLGREVVLEIPIDRAPYLHSFAQTAKYLIFVEFPLFWDVPTVIKGTEIYPALKWLPELQGCRVLVIDKEQKKLVKTTTSPEIMWAYHHINAYEDANGDIVMDVSAYEDSSHMESFKLRPERLNNTFDTPPGSLKRLRVRMDDSAPVEGDVEVTDIGTQPIDIDLPRINEQYSGKSYQFAYGLGVSEPGSWWNTIIKVDVATGEQVHWFKEDHWPSEPLFIPHPNPISEDDGVLVSTVLGGGDGGGAPDGGTSSTSYLLVLDAKTMQPLGEALCPLRIPFISHGNVYDS